MAKQVNIFLKKGENLESALEPIIFHLRNEEIPFDFISGNFKLAIKHIFQKEADFTVFPLNEIPISLPDGLVIAGVSKRIEESYSFIHKKNIDQPFSTLNSDSKIGFTNSLALKQFEELKPECQTVLLEIRSVQDIADLDDIDIDFLVIEERYKYRLQLPIDKYNFLRINPEEIIPSPASGVYAYLCRMDDITTRQLLLNFHNSNVSNCTNIERRLMLKLNAHDQKNIACHIYKDDASNYHSVSAYWNTEKKSLIKRAISQSTSFGLADKLYNELIS